MSPIIANLMIALLAGTGHWQEDQFIHFFEQIDPIMSKEEVTLDDVNFVVDMYREETRIQKKYEISPLDEVA